MTLKTMPDTGTYFPPKCSVDGAPHYLVPVSMWHDHEDDAREAHVLQARVEDLELRLAVEAVNQELVDALRARVAALEAGWEDVLLALGTIRANAKSQIDCMNSIGVPDDAPERKAALWYYTEANAALIHKLG